MNKLNVTVIKKYNKRHSNQRNGTKRNYYKK